MSNASYDEYRRKRMDEKERMGYMTLCMLPVSVEKAAGKLQRKLEGYRYLKRDLGAIRAAIARIRAAADAQTDEDTIGTVLRQGRDYMLDAVRYTPIRTGGEIVMPAEDEWQLINLALTERCGICLKSDAEAKRCKLRKLLRRYVHEDDPGLSACGYTQVRLNEHMKNMNEQKQEI